GPETGDAWLQGTDRYDSISFLSEAILRAYSFAVVGSNCYGKSPEEWCSTCQADDAEYYLPAAASGSVSFFGFQRSTGLRAAAASSRRPMRVECGAFRTISGSSMASRAIARIASMN